MTHRDDVPDEAQPGPDPDDGQTDAAVDPGRRQPDADPDGIFNAAGWGHPPTSGPGLDAAETDPQTGEGAAHARPPSNPKSVYPSGDDEVAPSPGASKSPAPYPAGPATNHQPHSQWGPYPAAQPQFGRRQPQSERRRDADGYYPDDYYVGPDWMRIIVGGLAAVILLIVAVAGGTWLYDNYAPTNIDEEEQEADAEPTPTALPLVPVFRCAGDPEPISEMVAPSAPLVAGRTADSRWLAFRNPQPPPRQLWLRASSLPEFDASTVGVVSCASGPEDFPTPRLAPTPVPTIAADPTPTPLGE